jgi:hypothetical protein
MLVHMRVRNDGKQSIGDDGIGNNDSPAIAAIQIPRLASEEQRPAVHAGF